MKTHNYLAAMILAAALSCSTAWAAGNDTYAPDNTRENKQKQITADQQGQDKADLQLTQEIRKRIAKNKTLSTYAHNVKIITRNGAVTLQGPVKTKTEKRLVEKIAGEVAGKGNVTSEIEISPPK